MSALETWIRTPLAEGLGWALFHSLWQGALIAAVLAATLGLFRPSSPRARYGLACAALLACPLAFGVTLALSVPPAGGAILASSSVPERVADLPPQPLSADWTAPLFERMRGRLPWVVPFWMAGVALLYLRTLGSWMAAQRWRKAGSRQAPRAWQERLARLAARVRVSKPVSMVESWLVEAPVVIGHLRPVILIPASALTGLAPEQLEAVLTHELAHIRRCDYLVNVLQDLVEGLLFYHPAVWWISSRIRAEREVCCDDVAVSVCGNRTGYAAALAALERHRWPAGEPVLAATGGRLMPRIRRLLRQPEGPRPAVAPALAAALLIVLAGVALAAWQSQEPAAPPAPPAQPTASAPSYPPVPPAVAAQPVPPASPNPRQYGDGFAVFLGDDIYCTGWFNDFDREQARRHAKAKDFIWTRRGGKTYLIHDAETVGRARELFVEPSTGRPQWWQRLRSQRRGFSADLTPVIERTTSQLQRFRGRLLSQAELAEIQSQLARFQADVRELQARLQAEQEQLAAAEAELAELEREQAQMKARSGVRIQQTWRLLDEAIARGLAEPLPEK